MSLFSSHIPTKAMVPLCRQLATAYDAGIPIVQAFDTVGKVSKDRKVKHVMRSIVHDLRHGSTLGEAVQTKTKYFTPFFIHILAVGEQGGRLDIMLADIAEFYEDRLKMQRQIRSLMFLPMVELVAAWFLGTFALGILRVVSEAFAGTGGGTRGVLAYVDEYVRFQIQAMIVFAILFGIAIALSRWGVLRWITGAVSTFIWPLSTITRKFGLARFFRSLSLLVGSGMSIIRAIESAATVTANPYMERDLVKAVPHVKRGATLVEAFEHTRYLTPVARDMLAVGEQSGRLEAQLKKASEYHMNEASDAAERGARIFGLAIMVAVMVLIGGIIISFYSRLYGGMMDELGI